MNEIGHFVALKSDGTEIKSKRIWNDDKASITMGTSSPSDIRVYLPAFSDKQAEIFLKEKTGKIAAYIQNFGTNQSTYLNDVAVVRNRPLLVRHADTISFRDGRGTCRSFRFEYSSHQLDLMKMETSGNLSAKTRKRSKSLGGRQNSKDSANVENVDPNRSETCNTHSRRRSLASISDLAKGSDSTARKLATGNITKSFKEFPKSSTALKPKEQKKRTSANKKNDNKLKRPREEDVVLIEKNTRVHRETPAILPSVSFNPIPSKVSSSSSSNSISASCDVRDNEKLTTLKTVPNKIVQQKPLRRRFVADHFSSDHEQRYNKITAALMQMNSDNCRFFLKHQPRPLPTIKTGLKP